MQEEANAPGRCGLEEKPGTTGFVQEGQCVFTGFCLLNDRRNCFRVARHKDSIKVDVDEGKDDDRSTVMLTVFDRFTLHLYYLSVPPISP